MNDKNNQINLLFEGSPYFNAPTKYIMSVACKLLSLDDENIINKWANETIMNQLDIARKTHLKSYQGRIAVVGAEQDKIIPITHATALYESLAGKKAMWVIKGVGHNDWYFRVDPSWWETIMGFVAEKVSTPTGD